MYDGVTGCILAGGKSTRMGGGDKCLLPFRGQPLIYYPLSHFKNLFNEVCIVTNSPDYRYPGYDKLVITSDAYVNRGPLAGIHAGLAAATRGAVFFASCDMPFLSEDMIRRLVDSFFDADCDILVPSVNGQVEPLCGVYDRKNLALAATILEERRGNSVRILLAEGRTKFLELEDTPEHRREFVNINTLEELASLDGRHYTESYPPR